MNILIKVIVIIGLVLILLATIPSVLSPIADFLDVAFDEGLIAMMNASFDAFPSDWKAIFRILLGVLILGFIIDLVIKR